MLRSSMALALLASGCSVWTAFWPDTRTPADRAHDMAPKCTGQSDEQTAAALSPNLVEYVEPAYSTVPSGNDRAIRLRGARLHLRPTLNVSAEALQRTLECHQARVILADGEGLKDDPYVARGTWLDIRVESGGDGLLAFVLVDQLEYAQGVLDRARSFARTGR